MNGHDGLVVISVGDLEQVVVRAVERCVARIVEQGLGPTFLDKQGVAEMLGCCTKTVDRLVREEGLPVARRIMREPRFDRQAVIDWMRREPTPPTKLRRVK